MYDDDSSFNKTMFFVIKFSLYEDISTCIDYFVTQSDLLLHNTKRAPSDYEVRGCVLMNLLLPATQCIVWIVSGKLDTSIIFTNVVSNFYCRIGFRHDTTMSTRNDLKPFGIRFDQTNLKNLN